jgi:hypothetical protein
MTEILVIARTRMSSGNICMGAIEMETGRMFRLLDSYGHHFNEAARWTPGDVWKVEYVPHTRITPPHVEDVCIRRMEHVGTLSNMGAWIRDNDSHVALLHGPAEQLYDGTLTFNPFDPADTYGHPHTARLERGGLLPAMSLQLWETDRLLVQHRLRERGAWITRYDGVCPREPGVSFRMKHIGYGNVPVVIPIRSIVSLSLARWWAKSDRYRGREACYLQFCDLIAMPAAYPEI